MGVIQIRPIGNLGNRMFQYLFCKALQRRLPAMEVTGYDLPEFGLVSAPILPIPGRALRLRATAPLEGHDYDLGRIVYLLKSGLFDSVQFSAYGMRVEYLDSPAQSAVHFPVADGPYRAFGGDALAINVRKPEPQETMHGGYPPLPISYYAHLIQFTGLRPVFFGQLDDNWYTQAIRAAFPAAEYVPSQGVIGDFETLRASVNVAIPVSTFSWLGSWLSPVAKRIYMPLAGIFHPNQRRDTCFVPIGDERYFYTQFQPLNWSESGEQVDWVLKADFTDFQPIGRDEAAMLTVPKAWHPSQITQF